MKSLALRSFRLKNFKAVRDSRVIRFTPLTVFIGNNGSGKSSIVEGMGTLQSIVADGLDEAMHFWRGFEHIRHQGVPHELRHPQDARPYQTNAMAFELAGRIERGPFKASMEINLGEGDNGLFIQREHAEIDRGGHLDRDDRGRTVLHRGRAGGLVPAERISQLADGESCFRRDLDNFTDRWQFVSLVPEAMGTPQPQRRTGGSLRLTRNGSNIAQYLLEIRTLDPASFEGIVEAVQYVLPYVRDLQPTLTSELERTVYLQMTEGKFKVPGWLLSTGTLRVLALLALLRHPTPSPVIAIEEIENGLDPRTLQLVVEEIRSAIATGRTQVILTTHSPYLLDLLDLSHVVLVERPGDEPQFSRPASRKTLREWAKKFSPGQLYTMGRLARGGSR